MTTQLNTAAALETAARIRSLEQQAKDIKAQAAEIQAEADALRAFLLEQMAAADIGRIEGDGIIASRKRTPGRLVVDCLDELPARFRRQVWEPLTKELKAALKDAPVSGAHLESGYTLEIR